MFNNQHILKQSIDIINKIPVNELSFTTYIYWFVFYEQIYAVPFYGTRCTYNLK